MATLILGVFCFFCIVTVIGAILAAIEVRTARREAAALDATAAAKAAEATAPGVLGLWAEEAALEAVTASRHADAVRAGIEYSQRAFRQGAWVALGLALFGAMAFTTAVGGEERYEASQSLIASAANHTTAAVTAEANWERLDLAAQHAMQISARLDAEARVAADQALEAALASGEAALALNRANAELARARAEAAAWRTVRALPQWGREMGGETSARYAGAFEGGI
jgi:hypothetical protein